MSEPGTKPVIAAINYAKLAHVENGSPKIKRRKTPWVVGALMVASLALLIVLQSTNLWKTFTIESSSDLLLLYALSSLNFIAFVIFGFIFLRSIIKLVRERRTFEMGAQIKTRLLIYFFAVSLLPIIAMAVFSYLFMNRAVERWFAQIPGNVIREAKDLQQMSIEDRTLKLDQSTAMLATTLDGQVNNDTLAKIAEAGKLSHIEVVTPQKQTLAVYERDVTPEQKVELDAMLGSVRDGSPPGPAYHDGKGFDVAVAPMSGGRRLLVVPNPVNESNLNQVVDNSLSEFDRLRQQEFTIRRVGLLTLGVLTFLLIFASSWIAFYVARGLTLPIKALAEGAGEIARGNLGHRVEVLAEDELALLVTAFNEMSTTLEANSTELGERRRYIETVLEALPTGVVSFDADNRVSTINGAAINILGLESADLLGIGLVNLAGDDDRLVFERLVARARRVGHASDQTVLRSANTEVHKTGDSERTVAITASALPAESGVVLVIEDLSELIAAQRASAWQEVARRMAHEIKNPLTPIQLSAERIAKRFADTGHSINNVGKRMDDKGPLADVVHESTSTILHEVLSLKSMVDEFSRFARLPDAHLAIGDVYDVVRQAAATFKGRSSGLTIDVVEGTDMPEVMLDAEQLKRVFVNLIENAVEAFEPEQKEHRITVTIRHDLARDLIVAEVADDGKGIPPSDLQKLFQPYFSTKGRGTGLGLAIVNRIITEHHGRINVVANQPKGAKFIIELPVGG